MTRTLPTSASLRSTLRVCATASSAASIGPQLVALVSPTCAVCLDGVATVLDGLDGAFGGSFRAHIVWTPVLADDTAGAAAAAASERRHARVEHYWDATGSLSLAAHTVLDLAAFDRTVAWDVYLVYRAGTPVEWTSPAAGELAPAVTYRFPTRS